MRSFSISYSSSFSVKRTFWAMALSKSMLNSPFSFVSSAMVLRKLATCLIYSSHLQKEHRRKQLCYRYSRCSTLGKTTSDLRAGQTYRSANMLRITVKLELSRWVLSRSARARTTRSSASRTLRSAMAFSRCRAACAVLRLACITMRSVEISLARDFSSRRIRSIFNCRVQTQIYKIFVICESSVIHMLLESRSTFFRLQPQCTT